MLLKSFTLIGKNLRFIFNVTYFKLLTLKRCYIRNSVTQHTFHFENIPYKDRTFQKLGLCYKTNLFQWGVTQNE